MYILTYIIIIIRFINEGKTCFSRTALRDHNKSLKSDALAKRQAVNYYWQAIFQFRSP